MTFVLVHFFKMVYYSNNLMPTYILFTNLLFIAPSLFFPLYVFVEIAGSHCTTWKTVRDRVKWKAVLSADFMSSEESDPEDPMSLQKQTIPWREEKFSSFFYELNRIQEEQRTGQVKRQRKRYINYTCKIKTKKT